MRIAGLLLAAGCASVAPGPSADMGRATLPSPEETLEVRLVLVGDAGAVREANDPVLAAVARDVARAPAHTLALFLGDNIYPAGLPSDGAPGRVRAETRLGAQAGAAHAARGTVFLPGNHDWTARGAPGWDGVRRQAEWLARSSTATMAPKAGCPGPDIRDVSVTLRLIFLDSEWWLHGTPAPRVMDACTASTRGEVTAALRRALRTAAARRVLVIMHHPPISSGPHGGFFSLRDQVFPLRSIHRGLWLPLPILGSIWPTARRLGVSPQDQSHAAYRQFVDSLRSAFRNDPPLALIAGHEHQLGVFDGAVVGARHVIVSGAGSVSAVTPIREMASARFASASAGFFRFDVLRGSGDQPGPIALHALGVDRDGRVHELYRLRLD